jgi:replication fork protection complex subunit Tof1/Swi1
LSKKRRRRRRRSPSPTSDDGATSEDEPRRKEKKEKKEKKKKEKEIYKSAQFIEDSDVEYGDMEAFLEREKATRNRTKLVAETAGIDRVATMKPRGTKKRRQNIAAGAS